MRITLTHAQIDAALKRVEPGLEKYVWLQQHRDSCDVRSDLDFRKKFNGFYRVRRSKAWQDDFYDLLEQSKGLTVSFSAVLAALHRSTGCFEASFASKLVATLDPNMPVIDSIVLHNLKLRLPPYKAERRAAQIEELHRSLGLLFRQFLKTEAGRYLVARFRQIYPKSTITKTKMLDLVLWKTRPDTRAR